MRRLTNCGGLCRAGTAGKQKNEVAATENRRHGACRKDTASSAIARGLTTPTTISRGVFGVVATERVLQLLYERRILSTWFVPGHTIESYPDSVAAVVMAGHEIGRHLKRVDPVDCASTSQE